MNTHVNKIREATNGRQAKGWKIYANSAYTTKHYRNNDNGYSKCSRDDNWWGWCDGNCGSGRSGMGAIETRLKGCGTAWLNFGNCNSSECQVNVYIDGKKIATAYRNTHQKRAFFNFKNGSKLRITEGEGGQTSCMMMFNELKVISCRKCLPGIINSTKHRNILFNYCNCFNIMHVFYFIS